MVTFKYQISAFESGLNAKKRTKVEDKAGPTFVSETFY